MCVLVLQLDMFFNFFRTKANMLRQTINWKKGKHRETKTFMLRPICKYRQTDRQTDIERKKDLTKTDN